MEILRKFKVSEINLNNTLHYCWVQLIFDDSITQHYSVRWKWTTMEEPMTRYFYTKEEALKKYLERKYFASNCC